MKKDSGKNNGNSKGEKTPTKADSIIMMGRLNDFGSAELGPIHIEAERLRTVEKLDEAQAALKSIQCLQQTQPLEVRLEAFNLVLAASCWNLSRKAGSIAQGCDVPPLSQSVFVDLTALEAELKSGLTILRPVRSTPRLEPKALISCINNLKNVTNHIEYKTQLNQIRGQLCKPSVKNHILKWRLGEVLTDLLVQLIIPSYVKDHPEDDLTAFLFSIWQALRGLSGPDAYAPVSFLLVDSASVRLLLPNRLDEKSISEHFLFSAQAIHEVSDSLPYADVQGLVEQLMTALRNRLDAILLGSADGGEDTFNLWDKHQKEILYEITRVTENTENPKSSDGFLAEAQSVLEILNNRSTDAELSCLSTTAYALLHTLLRDKIILSVANAVENEGNLPESVKDVLPLYISLLNCVSRGRSDYWNDPVFLLWESTM